MEENILKKKVPTAPAAFRASTTVFLDTTGEPMVHHFWGNEVRTNRYRGHHPGHHRLEYHKWSLDIMLTKVNATVLGTVQAVTIVAFGGRTSA